ncbi:alpha/beta hydrolase [Kovacikia minuta CCNUW1]|uniref:alpha/beta hydrolase n=1 Tax=Kovacikia minuta TaxID=2931930 RepID=UPI001CCD35FD|nr:alpha/beta hydrolase [Kovacikia minuta]UBF26147.1 alpha/beta hydrolase [Kovacikia minuta CCNUW1]
MMDVWVDDFWKDQMIDGQPQRVHSFFVQSTAPTNIEDSERKPDRILPTISDVVESLYHNSQTNESYTGLVIQIHGYNTGVKKVGNEEKDYTREGWAEICRYINNINAKDKGDLAISEKQNSFVFLGFRWPSERVPSDLYTSATSLPIILKILFRSGLVFTAIGLVLLLVLSSTSAHILSILLVITGVALSTLVASLFILRSIVYFRDAYRATNFGVTDLVEFIRQLDLGLVKRRINEPFFQAVIQDISQSVEIDPDLLAKAVRKTWESIENERDLLDDRNDEKFCLLLPRLKQGDLVKLEDTLFLQIYTSLLQAKKPTYSAEEFQAAANYWNKDKPRIRLSFIAHSMGAFVTSQVIRILSDVFDPRAIGDRESLEKLPPSNVGRVFRLGRLILVSPDIPLITITSGRTNFLRSALRRFEEAYLFSNEGDLALRLASTAANYFSFPAKTRTQGYRLGNLSVSPKNSTTLKSKELASSSTYGILNLQELPDPDSHLLPYLEVNVLSKDRNQRLDPDSQWEEIQDSAEAVATVQKDKEAIADLFTFFDCTEYKDWMNFDGKRKESYVLILDNQKSPLKLRGYIRLFIAYVCGKRDVHGGYFKGPFTKLLIYRLAFLGFSGLLDSLILTPPEDFGIKEPLPDDLSDEINRLREMAQTNSTSFETPSIPPYLLPSEQLDRLQEKRRIALSYLSWLCVQRQIQVAVSPERYQVDIKGLNRGEIRKVMLVEKVRSEG